jgi:WD40 repeat protein
MTLTLTLRLLTALTLFTGTLVLSGGLSGQGSPAADAVAVLKGHQDTVDAVAVSPDGRLIATGSFDKTIKLWDAETWKEVRTYGGPQGHQGQVLAVAFSPKGDQLASGGADNTAKVWDVPGGFPARAFAATGAALGAPAGLDAVGAFLPAADQFARRARFASPNPVKNFPHPNLVDAVAFDETGTQLATGCHDGNLRIWDVAKGQAVKTIPAHVQTMPQNVQHPIYCVAWAPGGKQILTASYDKTIKLWEAASGNLVKEFKAAPDPKPGDKADPPKEPVGHRDQVYSAAFSTDGKFVASGGYDRTVKLWDVGSGKVVREFPNPDLKPAFPGEPAPSHPSWVYAVRFTPDDKYLITAGAAPRYQGYLAVWSVTDGTRVSGAERDAGPIQGLALFPDGSRLVLGCGPRNRLDTNSEVLVIKTPGR